MSTYIGAERIKYWEVHARLLFGYPETSPIIWIGEPAPTIQCKLIVERWQVGAKHCRVVAGGRRGKGKRKQITLATLEDRRLKKKVF
jgi:hypothetical protein